MTIPAGITQEDVLAALEDLDDGIEHSFSDSTRYDLVHEGRRYPPKAVVGLAARRVLGRMLENTELNGGDTPGSANPYLRNLGFTVMAKEAQEGVDAVISDADYVASTLDTLVGDWKSSGSDEPFASPESWLESRRAVVDAVGRLRADRNLRSFADALTQLPRMPSWFKQGAHRTFLGALADRASNPDAASIVADALTVPVSTGEASEKIMALFALAEETERMYPGPGFAPLAAAMVWCFQDPQDWPWLSAGAEPALHALRLLPRDLDPDERYVRYRELILVSDAPPVETVITLANINDRGSRSLSPGLYSRLRENSEFLSSFYETREYSSIEERAQAERNIHAALGEMDLLARGMNDDLAELLVRTLVTSKTDPRVGYDSHLPFRADAYAIHTIEKNMSMPSIRIWATPSGLAIGAHFGSQKAHVAYAEMADKIEQIGLPDDMQFFEVRQHKEGDRLRPAGARAPKGELFVGQWLPGGLAGPQVSEQILRTVAKLQAVFDAMVVASGEAPSAKEMADDPLFEAVEEFRRWTGYPTDADLNNKAERAQMATVISEDGLLGFDLPEFRRIYNTGRYAHPGPQSHLNSSLNQMSPEELDAFAGNLEYLLRGSDPLADRVNALMDNSERGVKGFGEAVITKLLAIEYPAEILPVTVYRGPKGKATMLKLLGLHEDGLDSLDVGTRLVRSTELLRDRLTPFFGEDTYGMSRFLYWFSEREDAEAESADEIDHIGNLADKVFIDREVLDQFVELLEDKGQIIFYGPPGTGKTYVARELARAIAPDPAQRMLVQFHPSTSYEDFFEGFRPETDAHGQLTYRLVKGPLALIAERAHDNPSKQYVMVIDEINRANLPKVFGELLFLLEYRDETIRSLYRPDEPFELPKNLWIIGTMNTADRSISLVDAAMRRRFHFVGFFPDQGPMQELLRRWLTANREPVWIADLLDMVNGELRVRLGGPHLQIGPSHFMRDDLADETLEQIWKYSVFPYIEEQLYGDEAGIREYRFGTVLKRYEAQVTPVDEVEGDDDDDPAPGME